MAVTYIDGGGGHGNLGAAMSLFDQFFGMGSQLRKQQLAGEQQSLEAQKQAMDIAQKGEQRAEDLHSVSLGGAKASAGLLQNELDKSNTDTATRNGSMAAFDQAPLSLLKPTTDLSDEELGQWRNLHAQNGVKDFSSAATAWNKATAAMRGKFAKPEGGATTQFTTGPDGATSVGGFVLPDLSKMPGFGPPAAPAAPTTAPTAPAGPTAPAASSPVAPANSSAPQTQLPSLQDLFPMMLNPFTRPAVEGAISVQNSLATNKEKNQQIEKNEREISYGTPEERKSESEFIRNAAGMSHRLDELRDVVKKYGNYEYWNPEGAAKLKSLPMDISDNWSKVAGGGVLREGSVKVGMEHQIPIPSGAFEAPMIRNGTTLAAIDQTKKVLADYVRQFENNPNTRQPVAGLTPEVRQLVGETRFGSPDKIPSGTSPQSSAQTNFKSMAEFQGAVKAGNVSARTPVIVGGSVYDPGPNGWVKRNSTTNLPPVSLPLVTPPQ